MQELSSQATAALRNQRAGDSKLVPVDIEAAAFKLVPSLQPPLVHAAAAVKEPEEADL